MELRKTVQNAVSNNTKKFGCMWQGKSGITIELGFFLYLYTGWVGGLRFELWGGR